MSAARDLALWVKEHIADDPEGGRDGMEAIRLANATLADAVMAPPPFKSIEERAHEMWMVSAGVGEVRLGPAARDIIRTIRFMDMEIANPTPFKAPPPGQEQRQPAEADPLGEW